MSEEGRSGFGDLRLSARIPEPRRRFAADVANAACRTDRNASERGVYRGDEADFEFIDSVAKSPSKKF